MGVEVEQVHAEQPTEKGLSLPMWGLGRASAGGVSGVRCRGWSCEPGKSRGGGGQEWGERQGGLGLQVP